MVLLDATNILSQNPAEQNVGTLLKVGKVDRTCDSDTPVVCNPHGGPLFSTSVSSRTLATLRAVHIALVDRLRICLGSAQWTFSLVRFLTPLDVVMIRVVCAARVISVSLLLTVEPTGCGCVSLQARLKGRL